MARFSASRLKAHMNCGLAARYRYIDNLPRRQSAAATFGTVVHRALEAYNNGLSLELAIKQFRDEWADPASIGVEPDYWPKHTSYNSYRERGVEVLRRADDMHRFQNRTVLGTEIGFVVPFGEHELTGYIDLLEIERSGTGTELLKVVDYKTSASVPTRSELALDVQCTVYLWAVNQEPFWIGGTDPRFHGVDNGAWWWQMTQDMPKRAVWHSLHSSRQIDAGPRTDTDYGRLYRVCQEIQVATDAGIAVPKIGEACQWCDYVEPCALEIPVAINAVGNPEDQERWL